MYQLLVCILWLHMWQKVNRGAVLSDDEGVGGVQEEEEEGTGN